MKTFFVAAVLIALLVGAAGGALYVWVGFGDIEISTAGILAMIGGIVLTLAVGMGLMFLVFYSSRHGKDEN